VKKSFIIVMSCSNISSSSPAKIAVLGAGWWSQGWHIPHLHRNPNADLVAIVDPTPHPRSNLNPDLEPLSVLASKYETRIFASVEELLQDNDIGPTLQGVIVCTPHSTHSNVGQQILEENRRRLAAGKTPIHILMEKPFTTRIDHAQDLHDAVSQDVFRDVYFAINHTGNYRAQTKTARGLVQSGAIGNLRFVNVFFASPLSSIFEDPANRGWNEPSEGMLGNGEWTVNYRLSPCRNQTFAHTSNYVNHSCRIRLGTIFSCLGVDFSRVPFVTTRNCVL